MSTFYPITKEAAKKLRQGKLTASEWKIWSYLICVDPWGKHYQDLDTFAVMSECEVSRATFYRSIAKFQELELFDFQDKGFSIRNLCGVSSLKNETTALKASLKIEKNRLKTEKAVSKMRQDSQNCEKRGSKVATSASLEVSKISLDQLDQLDQIDQDNFSDFSNSENSEKLQNGLTAIAHIAIQISKTDAQIETLELVQSDELAETTDEVVNPINGDSFRRALEDFILKTLELSPRNRKSYFSKFTPENWEGWEDRYRIFLNQPRAKNFARPQDPHIVEQSISIAVKCKDFDFARCKIDELSKSNPSLAAELMIKFFGQEVTK